MAELGVGVGEEEEEVEEQGEPPAPLSREEEARLHYVLNGLHSWLGGVACGMGEWKARRLEAWGQPYSTAVAYGRRCRGCYWAYSTWREHVMIAS